ncbi:MAG: peptidylprolyl isomerase [Rhodospirillaceae bacterium]|nr:peptidylprolyl isomerase [Magnetovibrio sp.]MAY65605.1 peptidylprolyl isomerase [Rhodospirillaceae bacterium]|tara:strand:+ start:253 stop:681 length:429 start_codon:yes stop_codon:yes gene_type:complete
MKQATAGDTVRVHYTGTLEDGSTFDTSKDRDPMEVNLGSGQILSGVEDALIGMAEGDTKKVTLAPDDAFGDRNPELVQNVGRSTIPAEIPLEVGAVLEATNEAGNPMHLVVVSFDDEEVTLDANHPLAGKALTFDLTLVSIT